MSQIVKLITSVGPLTALSALPVTRDGVEVTLADLVAGDTYVVTRGGQSTTETVVEVLPVSAEEEREFLQDQRIATLEHSLQVANDTLLGLQRTIVELTASHIDRIFSDPVMVDTLAQRFFIAGANAIAFKARQSKERTPQLVVIESPIPGAIKVTLTEEGGVKIEEQLKDTGEWVGGDQLSEQMRSETFVEVFGNLLAGYGAEIGRAYYVVEDVHLEEFRKQAQASARETLAQTAGAAAPVVEEAQAPAAPADADPAQFASEAPVVH